jgi:outer membrane protein TolC
VKVGSQPQAAARIGRQSDLLAFRIASIYGRKVSQRVMNCLANRRLARAALLPKTDTKAKYQRGREGPIPLKKSEYRLGAIFSAPWVRLSNADAGGLIISLRLNGGSSKSIYGRD